MRKKQKIFSGFRPSARLRALGKPDTKAKKRRYSVVISLFFCTILFGSVLFAFPSIRQKILSVFAATFTDNDDSGSGFGGGTKTGVQWDGTNTWLEVDQTTDAQKMPDGSGSSGWTDMTDNILLLHMDEADTESMADASSNSYDGAAYNGVDTTASGHISRGGSFDGSNDFVSLGNDSSNFQFTYGSSFSISVWVNAALDSSEDVIVGNGYGSTAGYYLAITSANKARITLIQDGSNSQYAETSALSAGWNHIVATWNGSALTTYLNGSADTTTGGTGTVSSITSSNDLTIGYAPGSTSQYFNGSMDMLGIYNAAISAGTVTTLYNSGTGTAFVGNESNLVAGWNMDETTWDWMDTSNTGNDFTANIGTTGDTNIDQIATGKINQAYEFDGTNDYIVSNSNTGISGAAERTLMAWINVDAFSGGDGSWMSPASVGTCGTNQMTEFLINNSNHSAYVHMWGSLYQLGEIEAGNWHHLAVTYDGVFSRSYLNGHLVRTDQVALNLTNTPLTIGGSCTQTYRNFNGLIDEVALFDNDLGPDQINTIYERQVPDYYGEFESRIFDGSSASAEWQDLNWVPEQPTRKSLPDAGGAESAYSASNVDMSNNIFLMHGDGGVTDSGPYGYDGVANYDTTTTTGKLNGGAILDGTNDNIIFKPIDKIDKVDEFSFVGWFNQDTLDATDALFSIYPVSNYILAAQVVSGNLYAFVGAGTLTQGYFDYSAAGVTGGSWFHYAFVYDGNGATNADKLKVYINGSEQTLTYSGTIPSLTANLSTRFLEIGSLQESSHWDGNVDEVSIYGKALSSGEISSLYNSGAGVEQTGNETDLWGLWHFNESSFDLDDTSSNDNDAVGYAGVHPTDGVIGSGLAFDGVNSYVQVPATADLDRGNGSVSLGAWIRQGYAYSSDQLIIEHSVWSASDTYQLDLVDDDTIAFNFPSMSSGVGPITYDTFHSDGKWHHVVGVFDTSANMAYLYFDGAQVNSKSVTQEIGSGTSTTTIGARSGGSIPFHGSMDEIFIFDDVLSATEIEDMYTRGANQLKFQVRSCDDNACSGEVYIGPGGNGGSYYDEDTSPAIGLPNLDITGDVSSNRYFQYKAIFQAFDSSYSPELNQVMVGGLSASDPIATITDPTGTQSGDVTINYSIADAESDAANITVEYSTDGGSNFSAATQGTGGDGTTSLSTSPGGTAHTFVWASGTDVAGVRTSTVKVRISPTGGGADTTSNFSVDNDNVAPQMDSGVFVDTNSIRITYNESMKASTATNSSNYTLTSNGTDNGTIAITSIDQVSPTVYDLNFNQNMVCNNYTIVGSSSITDDSLAENSLNASFDTVSVNNADGTNTTITTTSEVTSGMYRCHNITLDGAITVTMNGYHLFETLTLSNSATLTHDQSTTDSDYSYMDITVDGTVTINTGTSINVNEKGCNGPAIFDTAALQCQNDGVASTYASHGGAGLNLGLDTIYDYVDDPMYPGNGSVVNNQDGGGVVRILGANIVINGTVTAEGQQNDGAGGAIRLATSTGGTISGTGTVTADGGGNGAGGRVAFLTSTMTFSESSASATSDLSSNAGAGTVFIRDLDTGSNRTIINNASIDNDKTDLKSSYFNTYAAADQNVEVENGRLMLNDAISFTSLTVKSGGEVSHLIHTTTDFNQVNLTLSGDLDVQSGGVINVNSKGCPGNYNFNESSGFCDTNINATSTYGSHAAPGLLADTTRVYGDIDNPVAPGGGSDINDQAGGGVVIISAANMTINGDITADGTANDGAGGSINLTASGTISGAGTVTADGGATGVNGGGGRIAVRYGTLTLAESSITTLAQYGRGTIFLKQTSGDPRVYIGNGTLGAANTYPTPFRQQDFSAGYFSPTPTFDSIVIDRAYVELETDVTVTNGITVKRTGQTLSTNTDTLYIDTGVTITGDLNIETNGHVTHPISTASAGSFEKLDFTVVGDITIDSTSTIDVSGRGCPGNYHFDTVNLDDCSIDINASSEYGSHGGAGLNAALSRIYDYIDDPRYPGGGSDANDRSGGGVLDITATNIVNNGTIKANYQPGGNDGAGGSIKLTVTSALSGTGTITANASNGGGGRVAVSYATSTFTESNIQARAGNTNGGAGTVYITDTTAGTNKVIFENNSQDNDKSSIDPETDFSGSVTDELIIRNGRLILQGATNVFNDVTIESGGEIAHLPNTTSDSYKVSFTSTNLDIQSGALITANSRGCPGNYNFSEGTGLCSVDINGANVYGSHGGPGLNADSSYVYGDIDNPVAPGGGSDINDQKGGGVIILNATNITVDGDIVADGTASDGAGGSINITASGTISGSGSITADGGSTGVNGGGGRIAIRYGTLTLSESNITALSTYGRGTIFLKQTSANPKILIGNGTGSAQNNYATPIRTQDFSSGYFSPTPTFDSIVIDRAYVEIFRDLTVANGITAKRTGQTISTNTDTLYIDSGVTITGDISLETNGHMSHPATTASSGDFEKLSFTVVGDITVDATSTIDVSGRGCPANYQFDRTNKDDCSEAVDGTTTYGSHGGSGLLDDISRIYDYVDDPQYPGDGSDESDHAGGGVIDITATNIINNGTIRSDDQPGGSDGGGGSIKLTVTDTLSGSGTITANASNGGGGRVAIYYDTLSLSTANIQARAASTNGGVGTVFLRDTGAGTNEVRVENNGVDSEKTEILSSHFATYAKTNTDLTVTNATLMVTGTTNPWVDVSVENTGILSHFESTSSAVNRLVLDISGDLTVASGAFIDARNKGCQASKVDVTANTNDGDCSLTADTRGSHGGYANGSAQSDTYGDLENPFYPGSGSTTNSQDGGGVIIISAADVTINGTVRADSAGGGGEGAGGSIKITATGTVDGTGVIDADGGGGLAGLGGGGRVAILYQSAGTDLGIPLTNITANGYSDSSPGTPGTVYLDAMGATLTTKSGGLGGSASVTYKLFQDDTGHVATNHDIQAIYSVDGGSTWQQAIDNGGASEGKTGLSVTASPGTSHTFIWDTSSIGDPTATLRLRSSLSSKLGQDFETDFEANTLPVASNVSIDSGAASVDLSENTTTNVVCQATITDDDGCDDLVDVDAVFYYSGVSAGDADDDNNHYSVTCSLVGGSCTGGVDTDAVYTCTFATQYYAEPTSAGPNAAENWQCQVTPNDDAGAGTPASDDIEMNVLAALNATASISYGTQAPGTNTGTTNQTIAITNTGNTQIDAQLSGTDMTCTTNSIPVGNQKFDTLSVSEAYASLNNTLTSSATEYDFDIAKRTGSVTTFDTFWGLAFPTGVGGSCSGNITLTAVEDINND